MLIKLILLSLSNIEVRLMTVKQIHLKFGEILWNRLTDQVYFLINVALQKSRIRRCGTA